MLNDYSYFKSLIKSHSISCYNSLMRKILILTVLSILSCHIAMAQFMPTIPENTLQAAQEAAKEQMKPTSEVVRVGIGNINFSNYKYSDITIFGTGDTQVYDNRMLIGNFGANKDIRITYSNGAFNIYTPESNIPEKVAGPVQITSNYGLLGIRGLKRAGSEALYHGAFELVAESDNLFNLVNMVEVEEYLKGVVPNEMPVSFGLEALKAQSVAARNYVLSPRTKASKNYDVVDSVASQVYYGANTEKPLSNQAVKETEGIVALYNWDMILALYSSTAGGYTESYSNAFSDPKTKEFPSEDKPYLKAKPDIIGLEPLDDEESAYQYYTTKPSSYDVRSSYYRWEKKWTSDELKNVLQNTLVAQSLTGFVKPAFQKGDVLDDLVELKVIKRGESGKIIELEIITKSKKYKVFKELVIRRLLTKDGKALPSANVVFNNIKDENDNLVEIEAYGGGYGHGVGMSQFGAGFMGSELHKPFTKILQHYYSGITLATKPVIISSNPAQRFATQNFYTELGHAKVIIDNKYGLNKLSIDINGHEKIFDLPKEKFTHKRFSEIDISNYIQKGRNTVVFTSPDFLNTFDKGLRLYIELVEKDDSQYIW